MEGWFVFCCWGSRWLTQNKTEESSLNSTTTHNIQSKVECGKYLSLSVYSPQCWWWWMRMMITIGWPWHESNNNNNNKGKLNTRQLYIVVGGGFYFICIKYKQTKHYYDQIPFNVDSGVFCTRPDQVTRSTCHRPGRDAQGSTGGHCMSVVAGGLVFGLLSMNRNSFFNSHFDSLCRNNGDCDLYKHPCNNTTVRPGQYAVSFV